MSMTDIKAGGAYVELLLRDKTFLAKLKSAGGKLKQFGGEVSALGKQMMAMSAAILAPIGAASKVFANFDDKMREVKAVTQATGDQFLKLTEKAKQLGATTSFTAVEVGGLMAELGRAGFKPDQIENMTQAVLDLARATSTDAVQASGIMAASIRQFGLAAEDATSLADALTTAANKSFNTLSSLGESLSYAGPVANDFNMSMEDTLAVLGALGNVGIQGSNAGTAMRRLLTLTGAEAKKLERIFGVSFVDAAGNARPLVDTLDEVNKATAGLGTAARSAKFNEAFGLLGITGASVISKSAVNIRELREEIANAGGVANKTAQEMDAGFGGAMRKMWSAIEGVGIALGTALEGELTAAVQKVQEFSAVAIQFVKDNQQLIVTIVKWVAGIGAAGAALFAIGTTISVVGTAMTALSAIGSAAAAVFGALASPIGAVAAVIVGLGAAVSQSHPVVEAFKVTVTTLWEALQSVASTVWGNIKGIVVGTWERITEVASSALNWLQSAAITAFSAITFAVTEWKVLIATALVSAALSIVRFASQVSWVMTEVIPKTLIWLYENWRDIFKDLANMVGTVATNIWKNLVNLKEAIASWFRGDGFQFEWTQLTDGFESAIKELPDILERQKGPLEQELEAELRTLADEVGKKWVSHSERFKRQIQGHKTPEEKQLEVVSATDELVKQQEQRKKEEAATGGGLGNFGGAAKDVFATFSAAAAAAQGQGAGKQDKIIEELRDGNKKNVEWLRKATDVFQQAMAANP